MKGRALLNRKLSTWPLALLLGFILGAGCTPSAREVVIISTNDIHAQIDQFPQLATAVERCRDTAEVILIDAGDRWTGNAYVDLAEERRPIIELMNRLEYDLAALGNHEFDGGQELLEHSAAYAEFPILCANLSCGEGALLRPFEPNRFLTRGGIRLGITSVVTNYGPNNHPDGHDHIFEGLSFSDAVQTAAAQQAHLASRSDITIALTHMGLERDRELAAAAPDYDLIIGGHSHDRANEQAGKVLITQTGKNLKQIGVTTIRLSPEGEKELRFRLLSLENYEPHPDYAAWVEEYKADPTLKRPVGVLTAPATRIGLAYLFAESVQAAAEAEIGLYHYGGVRLDTLGQGEVPILDIFNLDPFSSQVSTLNMTPEELRRLIITKFNDTVKPSEAHCIDLFATIPYTVVRDAKGDARDVEFPTLEPGRRYRVAMGDYVYKTYREVQGEEGMTLPIPVTDALLSTLARGEYTPSNTPKQQIR